MGPGGDNPLRGVGRTSSAGVVSNARADGLNGLSIGLAMLVANHTEGDVARPQGASARTVDALRAEVASRERRQDRRRRSGLGAGAALLVLLAAGLAARTLRERPATALTYTVDGAAPPRGGYVRSSPEHEPLLTFSDGTRIQMLPRARARVVDLDRRGARVVLEEGRAHVEVVHRPGAEWLFEAGVFVIHVHGTAFFVEWNTAEARLDVHMENGVISVDDRRGGETVVLRAGQSLSVSLRGPAPVAPAKAAAAARASVGVAPPTEAPAPSAPAPGRTPVRAAAAPALASGWPAGLADGHAAAIVADAERRGLDRVLARSSSEDLAALADAARYQRRDELARRALLAQRRRFPRSARAQEAAFLLGRLEDGGSGAGDAVAALSWYDRYLRQAPRGTYAGEALGRKMMVLQREHRSAEARTVAADYMQRFPDGIYAHAARALAPPAP
jgi:TolA-binding protein